LNKLKETKLVAYIN